MIRPLLHVSKEDVRAALPPETPVILDPLNTHPKYLRSRVRAVLEDDDALRHDVGQLCEWVAHTWGPVEQERERMCRDFVMLGDRRALLDRRVVHMLSGADALLREAALATCRVVLGHCKGTPRMRDHLVDHLAHWLVMTARCRDLHGRWSQGGVVAERKPRAVLFRAVDVRD